VVNREYISDTVFEFLKDLEFSSDDTSELRNNTKTLSELYNDLKQLNSRIDVAKTNKEEIIGELINQKRDLLITMKIIRSAIEVTATLKVLSDNNIPVTKVTFENSVFTNMVSFVHQNANFKAFSNILSNEAVHNRLYINQRSSTDQFKTALLNFGKEMNLENFVPKGNVYSPYYIAESKLVNSAGKDGISKSAAMNKFLALMNQIKGELNSKNIVWKFNTIENGTDPVLKIYNKYGTLADLYEINSDGELVLTSENERVIQIIGNIIGMFADAAKDPIPGALGLNEVNTAIALSMIGLGIPFEFALGFNFIGSVRKAVKEMEEQSYGISESMNTRQKYFSSVLDKSIKELEKNSELKFEHIDNALLEIVWNKPTEGLTPESVRNNNLSSKEVGYTVRYNNKDLSVATQEYILLNMYALQAKQSLQLSPINSATSGLFKALNPDTTQFDKISNTIQTLKQALFTENTDNVLFTLDTLQRLFDNDKIFNILGDTVNDLSNQLDYLFVERSPLFKQLTEEYGRYYETPQELSQRIVGFLAIKGFMNIYKQNELENATEETKPAIQAEIDQMLKIMSTFGNYDQQHINELADMKSRFPNNAFLSLLHVENTGATIIRKLNGKDVKVPEKIIRIFATNKLKNPEYAGKVLDDLKSLQKSHERSVKLFINALFFKELARTGMQSGTTGAYLTLFSDAKLSEVSKPLDKIIDVLKTSKSSEEILSVLQTNLNIKNKEELTKLFNDLTAQLVYGINPDNPKIKEKNFFYVGTAEKKNYLLAHGETRQKIEEVLKHIFGQEILIDSRKVHLSVLKGEEINLDFDTRFLDTKESLTDAIALNVGIIPQSVMEEGLPVKKYKFPPFIKWGKNTYVIASIDGSPSTMGENMLSFFDKTPVKTLVGLSARYNKIVTKKHSSLNKAVHMSLEQIQELEKAQTEGIFKPLEDITQDDIKINCKK
jgi:hypothetical protein